MIRVLLPAAKDILINIAWRRNKTNARAQPLILTKNLSWLQKVLSIFS